MPNSEFDFINSDEFKQSGEMLKNFAKMSYEDKLKLTYEDGKIPVSRATKNLIQSSVLSDLNQISERGETLEEQDARLMREYAPYLNDTSTDFKEASTLPINEAKEEMFEKDMAKLEAEIQKPKEEPKSDDEPVVTTGSYQAPQVFIPNTQSSYTGYNPYMQPQMMGGYPQQPMMQPQGYYGQYTAQPQMMYQPQQTMYIRPGVPYIPPNAGYSDIIRIIREQNAKMNAQTAPLYGGPGYYPGQYSYMNQNGFYNQYAQQYNEWQQQQRQAYEADLDLASTLLQRAHNYLGGNQIDKNEAKKILTTPPQQKMIDLAQLTLKDEIYIPTVHLMEGDKVLYTYKAHIVRPSEEQIKAREQSNYNFKQAMIFGQRNYEYYQMLKQQKIYQERMKIRNAYPLDMTIDQFFNQYGTEMYIDVLNYEMERQQRQAMNLYNSDLFSQMTRQYAKRMNPYGYGTYGGFKAAGENGGFIPFQNTGDLSVDLPNHLRAEHDRRKAEFFQKIVSGRTRV
ncbi:MAG: hypothetical protein J6Y02_23425 [Pseudobutyrivibrio sp.]|nr:hypothetical protein [Pseudobutyrivibrio sp.]